MAEKTMRNRPSIFKKTDSSIPEHTAAQPPGNSDAQTSGSQDVQTSRHQRIKATFHLNAEDIIAIDQLQTAEFKRTGKKPERSQLVSRAIQNLLKQSDG